MMSRIAVTVTTAVAAALTVASAPVAYSQPVDRTTPPALGPPPELRLPPIVQRSLPNGLKLLIVEHRELPLATFNLVIGSGATHDPAGRSGAADFTAAMLREGAGNRSSLDIAEQASFLGAFLSTSASWDGSTVFLHTPTVQLDSALALFADVALRPTFPTEEVERMRGRRLTAILQRQDQPPVIADLTYASVLYGSDHPYGQPLGGSEPSVREVARDELAAFYNAHYRPNNATLIVVGAVSPDDIERRIAQLFGAWAPASIPQVTVTNPGFPARTTIYVVDKPGAPQSSFRLGHVGVPRSTEDYFPLVVANTILGGSFTSRLNQNLRETKGYTYGAGSGFAYRLFAGPFVSSAEIVAEKTDSALVEFMRELRAIQEPVPEDELTRAKRYLQLRYPAGFETTTGIANQLVPIVLYSLPLEYFNGYVRNIDAVTQTDVRRVASRYIHPDRLAIVIVGDRQQIESPLRNLGIGEMIVRDVSGRTLQ